MPMGCPTRQNIQHLNKLHCAVSQLINLTFPEVKVISFYSHFLFSALPFQDLSFSGTVMLTAKNKLTTKLSSLFSLKNAPCQ